MRLSRGSLGSLTAGLVIAVVLGAGDGAFRGATTARTFAQETQSVDQDTGRKVQIQKPGSGERTDPQTSQVRQTPGDEPIAARERRSASVFRLLHERKLSSDTGRDTRIEIALEEPVDFKIEPQSLRNALDLLATKFRIPITIDRIAFEDANVDLGKEVSLNAPGISLRDTLELLFESMRTPLGHQIRHATLMISTVEKVNEDPPVVVYDCRDLVLVGTLEPCTAEVAGNGAICGGGMGGGGMFQAPPEPVNAPNVPQKPTARAAPDSGVPAKPRPPQAVPGGPAAPPPVPAPNVVKQPAPARPARPLPIVRTIREALGPESWDEGATITELGGLIVVRQSPRNHDKIKELLADIRRMRASGAFASFAKEYEAEIKRRTEAGAVATFPGAKDGPRRPPDDSNKTRAAESKPAVFR